MTRKALKNIKLLLRDNPHWDVEMVGPDGYAVGDPTVSLGFQARDPALPFWCSMRLKLYTALQILFYLVAGKLMAGGSLIELLLERK